MALSIGRSEAEHHSKILRRRRFLYLAAALTGSLVTADIIYRSQPPKKPEFLNGRTTDIREWLILHNNERCLPVGVELILIQDAYTKYNPHSPAGETNEDYHSQKGTRVMVAKNHETFKTNLVNGYARVILFNGIPRWINIKAMAFAEAQ